MILLIMDLNKNISERGIVKIILKNIDYKNIKLYNQLIKKYGDFDNYILYKNENILPDFALKYNNKVNWEYLSSYNPNIYTYTFYINNQKIINKNDYYYCCSCESIKYRLDFDNHWDFEESYGVSCNSCCNEEEDSIERFYGNEYWA